MIHITDKSKCCGCNACVQRCPKQCIAMHEDEEGFLYPCVDEVVCIDCGLCERVCPIINQDEPRKPLRVYAAKNNHEDQRLRSSSGGIFILLAEQTIKAGGVVFGARFDKNWEVEHCYAETLEELVPLMRSKYVQSRIGNTYKEAEEFLKRGRKVLFAGTSCQIAGLKKFLRKEYENLLAVDFICHGVPSPGVWRKYLEEIKAGRSEAAGKIPVLSDPQNTLPEISGINFREKQLGGYSWRKFGFVVHKSPSRGEKNTVLLSNTFSENLFMKGFLQNLYLRPSCYACAHKDGRSFSDITLGDYWGAGTESAHMDDKKGLSVVFAHNAKGLDILLTTDMDKTELTYEQGVRTNFSYYKPVPVSTRRNRFWREYAVTRSVCGVMVSVTRWDKARKTLNMYLSLPKRAARKMLRMLR